MKNQLNVFKKYTLLLINLLLTTTPIIMFSRSSRCKRKVPGSSQTVNIDTPPQVLVLQLARFVSETVPATKRRPARAHVRKIHGHVRFDYELDVADMLVKEQVGNPINSRNASPNLNSYY